MRAFLLFVVVGFAAAQTKPRARDLGVPFEGTPGPKNAITDVAGVEVGRQTLIEGDNVRIRNPIRSTNASQSCLHCRSAKRSRRSRY
jgi:hypothetical protein